MVNQAAAGSPAGPASLSAGRVGGVDQGPNKSHNLNS